MKTWVNDNGTPRELSKIWVNDNGTPRSLKKLWVNDQGNIRQIFERLVTTVNATLAQQLIGSDTTTGDRFGYDVVIEGDNLFVGSVLADPNGISNAGAVYLFTRVNGLWVETQKLVPTTAAADDVAGFSLGLSGDTLVIGAYSSRVNNLSAAGRVFVWVNNNGTWEEQATVEAPTPAKNMKFGNRSEIVGDRLFVSPAVSASDANLGGVFIYQRTGTTWSHIQTIKPKDSASRGDLFGKMISVSPSGDVIAIGGHIDAGANPGEQIVYRWNGSSYQTDGLLRTIVGTHDIALVDENTLLINDRWYIYDQATTNWVLQTEVLPNYQLTTEIETNGVYVAVGPGTADTVEKTINIYLNAGGTWVLGGTVEDPDTDYSDWFGYRLGLSGSDLVVGSNYNDDNGTNFGAVYVYTIS